MSTPIPDDDELLELLKSAQEESLAIPPTMMDLIMTGYDITNVDTAVAALVEDTSLAGAGAVRDDGSDIRLLAFEHDGFQVEFELRGQDGRLLGHIDAEDPGLLHLHQLGHDEMPVTLDQLSGFEITLTSGKPFRLRWQPELGDAVVTDWLIP